MYYQTGPYSAPVWSEVTKYNDIEVPKILTSPTNKNKYFTDACPLRQDLKRNKLNFSPLHV